MHFGASKVASWRAKIFSEMRSFRRTDSPRAKRRVHYGFLESPLAGFGEYTSRPERLSKKIADSCLASLTQIAFPCFEESILVFMGGPRVLFQIKIIKLKHRVLVLSNFVPIRGAVYWPSVCELQRVHFLFRDV